MFAQVTPGSDTQIPCKGLGDLREAHTSHGTSVGLIDGDDIPGIITLLPSLFHSQGWPCHPSSHREPNEVLIRIQLPHLEKYIPKHQSCFHMYEEQFISSLFPLICHLQSGYNSLDIFRQSPLKIIARVRGYKY